MKRAVFYVLLLSLLGGAVIVAWRHAKVTTRCNRSARID